MQKYRNRILFGVLIAVIIYVVLILVVDSQGQLIPRTLEALTNFPFWLLLVLVGTQLVVALSRFMVWQYYLGVIGARDKISRLDSAVIFVSCFVMVLSPGKAGELLKTVLLKLKTDTPVSQSAPIVVAERVVDGIAVCITLVVALLLATSRLALGDYLPFTQIFVFTTAAGLIFGLVAVQIRPLAEFCLKILTNIPVLRRLHPWFVDFYESSREIFKLKHVIPATLRGLGVYIFSSIGFVLILWGFGLELTPTLILQAVFINGVTNAIGALSFVPNGAGVTEVSTAAMLEAIVMPGSAGFTLGTAAAAAVLQGFFHKWFRVLLGLAVAVIFRNRLFGDELDRALELEEQAHTKTARATSLKSQI
jgi:glycosyltransferase 2 family protein